MAARKRTTLPSDFDETVKSGDIDAMKAALAKCEPDARGGYSKATALSVRDLPGEVTRWLVESGADLEAVDIYGLTALHHKARSWDNGPEVLLDLGANIEARTGEGCTPLHEAAIRPRPRAVLLARGADPLALDNKGDTPLGRAFRRSDSADAERLVDAVHVFLEAGDVITEAMRGEVARIGAGFEEMRVGYSDDRIDATAAALQELYALTAVAPVPTRVMHDGTSPIVVTGATTKERFDNLWELLVQPSGPATTVQGEVVRIVGRLAHEILGNGGGNWDRDFRRMADALPRYLATGVPVDAAELKRRHFDELSISRARELAVEWVSQNPAPLPLPTPKYKR